MTLSARKGKLTALGALGLWHQVTHGVVRSDMPDLSQRQLCLLLAVYLLPRPHTVRSLAEHLGVQRPVVTRALDTLSAMGFVARKRDEEDRRSVLVQRTVKGAVFLRDFADSILEAAGGLDRLPHPGDPDPALVKRKTHVRR